MRRTFTVKIRGNVYAFPLDDIVCFENELRRIHLHLVNGKEYPFYGTFRQVMPELSDSFLYCSRSYITNMDHIRAIRQNGRYEIILDNGCKVPLSKDSFRRAKTVFDDYLRRKQEQKERSRSKEGNG